MPWRMLQQRWHDLRMLPQMWREHRAPAAWNRDVDKLESRIRESGVNR